MKNNKRSLFILKYLTEQTDENHLATIADINEYLKQYDLYATRETISDCIKERQEVGYVVSENLALGLLLNTKYVKIIITRTNNDFGSRHLLSKYTLKGLAIL